jgi:class 3 adenylate cyclase
MAPVFPRVRYADADGVSIAYEVRGDGPFDLVRVPGLMGGLVASFVTPELGEFNNQLAEFCRLIVLDRRGLGLSDPLREGEAPPLEQQVADVVAVMDAAGSDRAALFGGADGGWVAILCAAMHPDRVSALILHNAWARLLWAEDFPLGIKPSMHAALVREIREHWGDPEQPFGVEASGEPQMRADPTFREQLAQLQQVSATRAAAAGVFLHADLDVRAALTLVQAPTLVLHQPGPYAVASQFLAEQIPQARLASYAPAANWVEIVGEVQEFLTGTRAVPVDDRVLATVLFTDIVGSTEHVERIGDHNWRQRLDRHDAMVRARLEEFRGREVRTSGDGFFATFDGSTRAIRCAHAVIADAQGLGIELRAGVHTGECEVRGDDYAGVAVHIGARVAALATAGQVLTTSTVRDLVAGSGITFADNGVHRVKGIAEPWHLYEVT